MSGVSDACIGITFEKAFGPERNLMGCSQACVKGCLDFVLAHVAMEMPHTSPGPKACKQICATCLDPPRRGPQECTRH